MDDHIRIGEVQFDLDIPGQQSLEQLRRASHDVIQIVGFEGNRLFAAEFQETPGEVGGLLRRGHYLVYMRPQRIIAADLRLDQVGAAHDDHEDIVEVMGHSPGEGADGLQFPGLGELVHEPLLFGDVPSDG